MLHHTRSISDRTWLARTHASLCVLGAHLRQIGCFDPVAEPVQLHQNVRTFTCTSTSRVTTMMKPNPDVTADRHCGPGWCAGAGARGMSPPHSPGRDADPSEESVVTCRRALGMQAVITPYDVRAGMEADLKADTYGMGLGVLRKRKLPAQRQMGQFARSIHALSPRTLERRVPCRNGSLARDPGARLPRRPLHRVGFRRGDPETARHSG